MKYGALALMAYLCLVVITADAAEERSRNWIRFQTWGVDSLKLYASYYPAQVSELPFVLMLHDRGGKGAKNRAVVAVARKLAVLLHRLWVSAEEYQPIDYVTVHNVPA